jgi:hypothetical protein
MEVVEVRPGWSWWVVRRKMLRLLRCMPPPLRGYIPGRGDGT